MSRVVSGRNDIAVLAGVLITAEGDRCVLEASDLEVSMRVAVPAEVVGQARIVLPGRLLADVVRSLPAERVVISDENVESGTVELASGGARFNLRTLRAEDFPKLPEPAANGRVLMPAAEFAETIRTVARAASRDETRPVLTGLLVSASGKQLMMVGTDSYRLAVKRTELEAEISGGFNATVPARALQEVARLVGDGEDDEQIAVSGGSAQAIFEVQDTVLSTRLIDGQFPDFQKLMPEDMPHALALDVGEFGGVVRRIGLLAQKNSPIRLRFADGQLTASAESPDVGEASESLPVPFSGEPLEIGFNPEFLRDGIDAVGSGQLTLKLITAERPAVIEDGGFSYLIMPIRLQQ